MSDTTDHSPDPILRTKSHRPAVRKDFLFRQRLHERLNKGLETSLTLVSVPADYGKRSIRATLADKGGLSQFIPCSPHATQ